MNSRKSVKQNVKSLKINLMPCQEEEKILEIKMDNFKMPDRQIYPQSNKKPLKVRRLNKNLVFFK